MPREDIFDYSLHVSEIYRTLETEILRLVADRLKVDGTLGISEWQIQKLNEFDLLNEEVIELLESMSGVATGAIEAAINNAGYTVIKDVDGVLVKSLGERPIPPNVEELLKAYTDQTFININNFVNQTLITTNFGPGTLEEMYTDIINKTTAKHIAGILTHQEALEQTILEWVDKGIPSSFYDRGDHRWSLERYVDIVLRSTLNRTYNGLRTNRMKDYDIHTCLVTTVMDAAERCVKVQGTVVDMRPVGEAESGYPSIYEYGYGEPDKILGINCRHSLIPFIPGVSVNNQVQFDEKESIARSKVRQQQRELERRIRRTKKNIVIFSELDSPKAEFYGNLLREQQKQIRGLLADADWLRRQPARERVLTPTEILMRDYYRGIGS